MMIILTLFAIFFYDITNALLPWYNCGIGVNWHGTVVLEDIVTGRSTTLFETTSNFNSIAGSNHGPFYTVSYTNELFKYEPCDPYGNVVVNSPLQLIGMATVDGGNVRALGLNPNNGLLYAIYNHGGSTVFVNKLFSIHPKTAQINYIGEIGTESSLQGAEFDVNGVLYSWSKINGLIAIDINTAAVTIISTSTPSGVGIIQYLTFDPSNNNILYGNNLMNIYEINKLDGSYHLTTLFDNKLRGLIMLKQIRQCNSIICHDNVIRHNGISKVECGAINTCQNEVIIIQNPLEGFELGCVAAHACDGLTIILNITAAHTCDGFGLPSEFRFGSIKCVGVAACKNMKLVVNNHGCKNIIIQSIECRDGSCEMADFEFNGNVRVDACMISGAGAQPSRVDSCFDGLSLLTCSGSASCLNQNKVITDPIDGFELICNGQMSCQGATFTISISGTNYKELIGTGIAIFVYCIESHSCMDINVVTVNENVKWVNINVQCVKEGSCEHAMFTNSGNVTISWNYVHN